ncbi:hypothetical protein RDWZM_010391 [Blomia tropicalis]|uniref:protein-serine/threonine phosphatase n=1 Tax=Blomia tropicalis TaxID=40697 RepID=A0A9Q0RK23_BLOTA|nr:hypothetical protein RDWZM_010391 [Blomia tropicalis]
MEDAHTILLSMPNDPSASFFAVFDGHGGAKVANYAAENLYKCVNTNPLYVEGRYEEALKDAFVEFDKAMFNDEKMRDELAGSTAVIILVKDGNIYCANIGDSRAVASFAGNVDPLSFDHKPTGQIEMNRIVSAGGWVQFNRVNGNLALSRAFGDFVFKRNEKRSVTEQIVIALPDVQQRPLSDELEFIVLACDGVWDVMTNDEVVEFVRRRIIYRVEPVSICEELITRCLAPDCQMGSGIGCDNMTVILICYLNGTDYETFCERVTACSPLGIPPPPPGVDEATVRRFFGNRVSHNNNNDLAQAAAAGAAAAAPAVVIGNSNENNGASTSGNVSSEQTIQSVRCVTVESLTIPSVMETMDDDNKKANEMEQTNLKMELNSSGDANTK